ncbi:Transcription initiation factor IIA subunit 2 [Dichanthelium oligosanthes]|uniref:Transcription initiation factor IIA subunit 2 n=1 Tax=Dichanthelium oligosanthes TaxID=888268 RepID=A0A1E5UU92_9POAL|nr:Transcription initiation factor IIA subunit 2 [Dichanthelium oligosanthes]
MATFELYRRSTIGMCLTETLDEMVSSGTLSPELAIQVLVQFDKSMTDALENQVKSKVNIKVCSCSSDAYRVDCLLHTTLFVPLV